MLPACHASLTLTHSKCGAALHQFEAEKIKSARIQNYIKGQGRNAGKTRSTNKQRAAGCYPDTDIPGGKSRNKQHFVPHTLLLTVVFTAVLPSIVKSVLWKISQAQARKVNSRLGEKNRISSSSLHR